MALASLDADLFSCTLCELTWLTPLLGIGSLLLFDEYLGTAALRNKPTSNGRKRPGYILTKSFGMSAYQYSKHPMSGSSFG